MSQRTPVKPCPRCAENPRSIGMFVVNLGVGRSRLVAIWACPLCRYEEGSLL